MLSCIGLSNALEHSLISSATATSYIPSIVLFCYLRGRALNSSGQRLCYTYYPSEFFMNFRYITFPDIINIELKSPAESTPLLIFSSHYFPIKKEEELYSSPSSSSISKSIVKLLKTRIRASQEYKILFHMLRILIHLPFNRPVRV